MSPVFYTQNSTINRRIFKFKIKIALSVENRFFIDTPSPPCANRRIYDYLDLGNCAEIFRKFYKACTFGSYGRLDCIELPAAQRGNPRVAYGTFLCNLDGNGRGGRSDCGNFPLRRTVGILADFISFVYRSRDYRDKFRIAAFLISSLLEIKKGKPESVRTCLFCRPIRD